MKRVTMTYPASVKREISQSIAAVAMSRTRHLHRGAATRPIEDLLMDAYLQAVADTITTLENKGLLA